MNLPNKLTVMRLCLIPVFVAVYIISFPFHEFVALGIFIIACLTDFLDGHIARKYNLVTDLGKFLDPIADKVLVMSALILLCVYGASDAYGINLSVIYTVGTIVILAREFIVTGFRMIAAGKNMVLAADKLGKAKTNFQMFAVIFLLPCSYIFQLSAVVGTVFLALGLTCFIFAVILTIMSAINYVVKNPEVLGSKKKAVEETAEECSESVAAEEVEAETEAQE